MRVAFVATLVAALSRNAVAQTSQNTLRAATNLLFMLEAPGNCLEVGTDLTAAKSPSRNMAALWIRAVFHDAAPYSTTDRPPGSAGFDGSLVNEFNRPDNFGLEESIASRFPMPSGVNMSKADLIGLGGVVSVRHCGGPSITYKPGRVDVKANQTNPDGRIPQGNDKLDVVKAHFARMGLSTIDMAVLTTGSHTMGGVHGAISPNITKETFVPFDNTPGVFDNDVFKQTLAGNCALPVDCEIAQDPELKPFIQLWASNETAFFNQYAQSFEKLMALTSSPLSTAAVDYSNVIPVHKNLKQEGTRVVYNLPGVTYDTGADGKQNNNTQTAGAAKVGCPMAAVMAGLGAAGLLGLLGS
ncbi:hypothetical protein HK104_007813 [Borealophlyctis nickersoniae]|nr:hypothetical protein HK104_007813 [Borealophlyctis nickersoniae]